MKKFNVQVGRDARVYYKTTLSAEDLHAVMSRNSRHGFETDTEWEDDGVDDFEHVETVCISDGETDEILAVYNDNEGWRTLKCI